MLKMQTAYLHKKTGLVVLDKSNVNDSQEQDFEQVTIAIHMSVVKDWAEELELLGLDDENE